MLAMVVPAWVSPMARGNRSRADDRGQQGLPGGPVDRLAHAEGGDEAEHRSGAARVREQHAQPALGQARGDEQDAAVDPVDQPAHRAGQQQQGEHRGDEQGRDRGGLGAVRLQAQHQGHGRDLVAEQRDGLGQYDEPEITTGRCERHIAKLMLHNIHVKTYDGK